MDVLLRVKALKARANGMGSNGVAVFESLKRRAPLDSNRLANQIIVVP